MLIETHWDDKCEKKLLFISATVSSDLQGVSLCKGINSFIVQFVNNKR